MFDAKNNLSLAGDVYPESSLLLDVMMLSFGIFPFFQGFFPNTSGKFLQTVFVEMYRLKLQGSHQRVLFLERSGQ